MSDPRRLPPRMPAVTVRPPWSQIIAESVALAALGVAPKLVENRGRAVSSRFFGHDIAIHAGKTWCEFGEDDPRVRHAWKVFSRAIQPREANPLLAAVGDFRTGGVVDLRLPHLWIPTGAVVAVATLLGCHRASAPRVISLGVEERTCCAPWGESWHNDGPAYHLVLANVRRLKVPVVARGQRQVPFELTEDETALVRAQLATTGG